MWLYNRNILYCTRSIWPSPVEDPLGASGQLAFRLVWLAEDFVEKTTKGKMSSNSIVEKGLYLADVLICKFIIHIRFHQPQLPFSNDCLLRWHVFSIKDWAVGLAGRSKDVDVWIRGNWPTGLSGNVEILWKFYQMQNLLTLPMMKKDLALHMLAHWLEKTTQMTESTKTAWLIEEKTGHCPVWDLLLTPY